MWNRKDKSVHHKIWQCNRSKFNVWEPENKIIVTQKFHDAFNQVFGVHQSPREQLMDILLLVESTLSERTKNDLFEILNRPDKSFYLRKLVK